MEHFTQLENRGNSWQDTSLSRRSPPGLSHYDQTLPFLFLKLRQTQGSPGSLGDADQSCPDFGTIWGGCGLPVERVVH